MTNFKGFTGGQYKPLKDEDIEVIHNTSMRIFEEVGIEVNNEKAKQTFKEHGARVDNKGNIVKFPKELVLKFIKKAPSKVLLAGREEKNDILLEDKRVYMGTGGTCLYMLDMNTNKRRQATLQDIKDMAKLVDALENIHLFMLPVYPHNIKKEQVNLNRFYAALSNTTKHIMGGVYTKEGIREVVKMAEIIAGSSDKLRKRPFISMVTCIISPLKLDAHYTELLMEVARLGIPLVTPTEPLCGATSPVTLAGNILIQNTETLSGIILAQMVNPGTPVLYGCISSIADPRSMRYLSGAIEMGMVNAAAAQMAHYYNLPIYATAGMSDSKISDCQSGYEKMATVLITALAGANYIHDAAGFLEFCLTASLPQLVIDNEILGMTMQAVKGIKVDEDKLAYEVIKNVGPGGHFMAEEHTVKHMRGELYLPKLSDREIREEWEKQGSKDTYQRAKEKAKEILDSHNPEILDEKIMAKIKQNVSGIIE